MNLIDRFFKNTVVGSLDGKPIEESNKIGIYHGFCELQIVLNNCHKYAVTSDGFKIKAQDGYFRLRVKREEEVRLWD